MILNHRTQILYCPEKQLKRFHFKICNMRKFSIMQIIHISWLLQTSKKAESDRIFRSCNKKFWISTQYSLKFQIKYCWQIKALFYYRKQVTNFYFYLTDCRKVIPFQLASRNYFSYSRFLQQVIIGLFLAVEARITQLYLEHFINRTK